MWMRSRGHAQWFRPVNKTTCSLLSITWPRATSDLIRNRANTMWATRCKTSMNRSWRQPVFHSLERFYASSRNASQQSWDFSVQEEVVWKNIIHQCEFCAARAIRNNKSLFACVHTSCFNVRSTCWYRGRFESAFEKSSVDLQLTLQVGCSCMC